MDTFIAPEDNFGVLAILLLAAGFGMAGERRGWFGQVSGIIVTIFFTALLVTFNVIPSASNPNISVPVYDLIFTYVVPVSIPLLLFNVNIRRVIRESGRLLGAFLIGAAGIGFGAALAAFLVPLGEETYKIAAVYTATYIGGSINFMAVADALDFLKSPLFPAAIAIDNVFTNFYLLFLFFLPNIKFLQRFFPRAKPGLEEPAVPDKAVAVTADVIEGYDTRLMEKITLSLALSVLICAVGIWAAPYLGQALGTDVKLDILIITAIIVLLANIFPRQLAALEAVAFQVGFVLLFVFLAVIGAASDIKEIIASTPTLLLFVTVTLLAHLAFTLLGCRLLKVSLEEIAIASCANVGGSTVSAPMAVSFKLKEAITPAILIGVLGAVLGTFAGVAIGLLLR